MRKINKIIGSVLISSIALQPTFVVALEKKETVYANLDYTGTPYKTTVNNHLYVDNSEKIEDETELKDILNINGDEKFELNDNKILWESTGKDIFYQGTTDKELPISISAKYYLNDEEKEVDYILGKSGKIKIELTFTNNSYILKDSKKLYTPIVATIGTIINDKYNNNIEITNGKAIDTGTKNMLVGIASPGLYESTSLEEFKELNKITITYDTTKFSLNNIYVVATPKLLEESDFDIFNKVDKLSSSMITIQDNMDKIESGAKELEEGSKTLINGINEISKNLKYAFNAINKLEIGSVTLDSSLKQIISSLEQAKATLADKNIDGSISQLQELKNGNNNAISTLTNTNNSIKDTYINYGLSNFSTADELIAYLTNQGLDQTAITNLVTCKKTYEGNNSLIYLLNQNNLAIDTTISSLTEISNSITTLLTELNSALVQVEDGAKQLSNGLTQLKSGVDKLYNGSVELTNGASLLNSGTSTLSNGIVTLNKEGINKLTDYTNKFKNYGNKAKELINLSKEYNGFTSNNTNNTIFIYKMKSAK